MGRTRVLIAVFLGIGVLATLALGAAQAAEINALRLWAGPEHTRAVIDVGGPLDYKVFSLDNPGRIVLDVRASKLATGFDAPKGLGLAKSVRTGKLGASDVRIVFDLEADARPKSFLLPPAENLGYRLVIDFYPKSGPAPVVVRTLEQALPNSARDVVIAVDAGHGGEDPGALGASGTREKNITLKVAQALAAKIDREPGMSAVLVRDGDYFIPLKRRYEKAREAKADLFVSIHADAFKNSSAHGSSVFVLSPRGASTEAARWLAESENRSDLVGGVSLDDKDDTLAAVLLDLSQGATLEASNALAERVMASLSGVGSMHKSHVERANFVVLRSPDVPSILVETAFISNPTEEKRLNDPAHRERLAAAILDGIRSHYQITPPPGTWLAANTLAKVDAPSTGSGPRSHTVSRGETLSAIALRHRVSVAALRSANRLRGDVVRVGAVLRIPVAS